MTNCLSRPVPAAPTPTDSSEIRTLRKQVESIIVQSSWKMVFASTDAEIDRLKADMQEEATGLGCDKVREADMSELSSATRTARRSPSSRARTSVLSAVTDSRCQVCRCRRSMTGRRFRAIDTWLPA